MTYLKPTLLLLLMCALSACSKPEENLADHLKEMTTIMEDNMDSPKDGVVALRGYIRENLPDILREAGEIAVELDKIEDDEERQARFKEMVKALTGPAVSFAETAQKFGAKVQDDKEAMKEVEGLLRTLEPFGVGAFRRYIQASKSAEAQELLKSMADGAIVYYQEEHFSQDDFTEYSKMFPKSPEWTCTTTGGEPNGVKSMPQPSEFKMGVWSDLRFSISKPHYYRYCYQSGTQSKSFAMKAEAALDSKRIDSIFCVTGEVENGQPQVDRPREVYDDRDCTPPVVR